MKQTENEYRILVSDETNHPIPGVRLRICSEAMCVMKETDHEGIVTISNDEGYDSIHIHSVPEGYETIEDEISLPETGNELTIKLSTSGGNQK